LRIQPLTTIFCKGLHERRVFPVSNRPGMRDNSAAFYQPSRIEDLTALNALLPAGAPFRAECSNDFIERKVRAASRFVYDVAGAERDSSEKNLRHHPLPGNRVMQISSRLAGLLASARPISCGRGHGQRKKLEEDGESSGKHFLAGALERGVSPRRRARRSSILMEAVSRGTGFNKSPLGRRMHFWRSWTGVSEGALSGRFSWPRLAHVGNRATVFEGGEVHQRVPRK